MTVKWKDGFDIQKFASKLEAVKGIDAEGKAGFEGFEFDECYSVLNNVIECSKEMPDDEKQIIVRKALMSAGAKGVITADIIKHELEQLELIYLKQPQKRFVFCTSLSVNPSIKLKTTKFQNAHIQFAYKLPDKYAKHASKHLKIAKSSLSTNPPDDYISAMISIYGRTPLDAANRAFEVIDLLRGIWNFDINRRQYMRKSYGNREPVNKIILGPLHTLHLPTGELATEMWWYDPDYQKAQKSSDLKEHLDHMYKTEKKARDLLSTHNYRNLLEWGIKEYCRALDHRNWSTSFLKLWSVLEVLTSTEKANYKVTIKRAAFAWADAEYHMEVLNHLRHLRNSFVHENKNSNDVETHVYQLKRYVEALIKFHFARGRIFTSLKQVSEFMDLPTNTEILKGKINILNLALDFRK